MIYEISFIACIAVLGSICLLLIGSILLLSMIYEISFIIACVVFLGSIWFVHHNYNIATWKLICGGVLLFGYSITYLECNRKLAMEEIIEKLQLSKNGNFFMRSWSSLSRMVGIGPSENERLAQALRNSAKIKLKFCRPDHVAWKYFHEQCIMHLLFIFEALTESFYNITVKFGFPYNVIVPPLFAFTFFYVLKLILMNFLDPKLWTALLYTRSLGPRQKATTDSTDQGKDRISGQNLTNLIDILHKISNQTSTINLQYSTQQQTATLVCSGVQEITEKNISSDQLMSDDNDNDEILINEQPLGENSETSSHIELVGRLIDKKPIGKNETINNCSEGNSSREPKLVTGSNDIELTVGRLIDKKPIGKNETISNCSEGNSSREPKLVTGSNVIALIVGRLIDKKERETQVVIDDA